MALTSLFRNFGNANLTALTYQGKLADDRQEYIDWVIKYRQYTEGDQDEVISTKQKKLIKPDGGDLYYKLNICHTVIATEVDRLNMRGVKVTYPDNPQLSDDLTRRVAKWFRRNRLDEQGRGTHYAACRDGDSYIIVEMDTARRLPTLTFNEAYDGETGVDMRYLDNNPNKPVYAVKRWIAEENTTDGTRIMRMNIYLPDRVLKMVNSTTNANGSQNQSGWYAYERDGETTEVIKMTLYGTTFQAGVQWWTDTGKETGQPLGIPVHHFRHIPNGGAYGRSALADVVPDLQDRLNRTAAALEYATLFSGFSVNYAVGYDPENVMDNPNSDGAAKVVQAVPGAMWYFTESDVTVGQLPPTDLMQLINAKDSCFRDIATVSATPLPMLNPSGQVAAEGTLQQVEAPLLAKVKNDQVSFGNTWEDVARMMILCDSIFDGGETVLTLDQVGELEFEAQWDAAETRNDAVELANATAKKALGIPDEQIYTELKYTADQIEAWKNDALARRAVVLGTLAQKIGAAQQTSETPPPSDSSIRDGDGDGVINE